MCMEIGEKLREARVAAGQTQEKVAEINSLISVLAPRVSIFISPTSGRTLRPVPACKTPTLILDAPCP